MPQTTYQRDPKVAIFGAGPAGLTAAYQLEKQGVHSLVLEKGNMPGGIARTEIYKGYRFDIGGHRFFTKIERVNEIWREVLDEDFQKTPRMSRIFYNDKFFDYPLKLMNVLTGLGPINSVLILFSYIYSRIRPYPNEDNFEEWVSNRFGRRLFRTFFKTYTEKVWGIPCTEIQAEWAAQRITNLTFMVALKNAIFKPKEVEAKSLIAEFDYPRLGPGQMWQCMTDKLEAMGSTVLFNTEVLRVERTGSHIDRVVIRDSDGNTETIEAESFISSLPVKELLLNMKPEPPREVLEATKKFKYRDFLTVTLIVDNPDLFPDNWIYIHSPKVQVGRIQNFKNWSSHMVPDQSKSCVGMEYFCNAGDELWNKDDDELIEQGKREIAAIGLAKAEEIIDGVVIRQPHAYPVYDSEYKEARDIVRGYIDSLDNLFSVGRNGLHRYDNQDHAMLSSILAVENMMGAQHDLWGVNTEKEYLEVVIESKDGERTEAVAGAAD
ncbi:MAG: NAD(P)/FAD-dependent oxidoreductase [Chloroflexi bacterium]|nr:NAD(P)/FAD-dependent oxidoreductase [Chloroflexota bacterium]MCH9037937.1 NAD(P)/FAD-dependent oxidoreductase [Chloroflexota bacterium]MCI0791447.1 NAD(P)/FAD-dependent oxidoreductase [Chloroflexota bacterium]